MFWSKTTVESKEFLKLYQMIEEQRIKVQALADDLVLMRQKLVNKRLKFEDKELEAESEKNKNPSIFLNPNGHPIGT